jgi:hypothetical protein
VRWSLALALLVTATLAVLLRRAPRTTAPLATGSVVPSRDCTSACAELVQMPPDGFGYVDQRLVGEVVAERSTSYARRDLAMLVRYAAAKVAHMASTWPGNGGPLVLGDMSERDGAIPGTQDGRIRHPRHSHEDGFDIDIAYYQRDTPDNGIRAVCWHFVDGVDVGHCTRKPRFLDAWRTALLVGAVLESPRVRVIGMDARVAYRVLRAFDALCSAGLVERDACAARGKLVYEVSDTGHGWFISHHHHLHLSLLASP